MNYNQSHFKESGLIRMARSWGRSRGKQVLGAVTVLLFFLGLAYLSWNHRDFAASLLTLWLASYGLGRAWRILPIPASTRARWAKERRLAKEASFWAPCQYRFFLFLGAVLLGFDLLRHRTNAGLNFSDFAIEGSFLIYGAISFVIFRLSVRNKAA